MACSQVLRDLGHAPADAGSLVEKLIECAPARSKLLKQRLDTSIVTPFDREDILALTEGIDHAVDEIRAAGEFIHLHHITEPLDVIEMAEILHETAEAMVRLMEKLPKLRDLQQELDVVDELESKGDDVYRRTMAHPVLRRVQGLHGAALEGHRRGHGERPQLLREGQRHRGLDRGQARLTAPTVADQCRPSSCSS